MTNLNKAILRLRSAPIGFIVQLGTIMKALQAIKAARNVAGRSRTPKQVVFISDRPRSREAKLAYGLQQIGWQVVLLHRQALAFDAGRYCVETRQYRSPWEALRLAACYMPVVYHVFSLWNFEVAATFIRHKPGKIILDDYDVMAGMTKEDFVRKYYPGQLELERFCLENADGICCRSLETQYAKKYMGYKFSGKRIFFADYCWNIAESRVQKSPDGCFTVANIGNLYIDMNRNIDHPKNYHLKLAVLLSQHGIRSYLFLSSLTSDSELFLKNALADNPYIRFGSLRYERLMRELHSQCHAGLICSPPLVTLMPDDAYRPSKRNYGVGNKAFDYIDAAIPIIMDSENRFLYFIVKRYHKVFDFSVFYSDLNECPRLIQNLLINSVEELSRARKILSVSHQAPRLANFYNSL